jgi:hypothetical protein
MIVGRPSHGGAGFTGGVVGEPPGKEPAGEEVGGPFAVGIRLSRAEGTASAAAPRMRCQLTSLASGLRSRWLVSLIDPGCVRTPALGAPIAEAGMPSRINGSARRMFGNRALRAMMTSRDPLRGPIWARQGASSPHGGHQWQTPRTCITRFMS